MADQKELTRTVNGAVAPHPGTYTLDKAHTTVAFVIRHLMVSKVRGGFTEYEGTIVVGEDPADSSVEVTIQTDSLDTRDAQRDAHVKSADFLEVEKFPTITFKSTKVTFVDGTDWKVEGDLTIHGVTKNVTLDVEFNGASGDPWGGTRIGFSATTEIDREEFGVNFNAALETGGVMLGKSVKIDIEAEAPLQA